MYLPAVEPQYIFCAYQGQIWDFQKGEGHTLEMSMKIFTNFTGKIIIIEPNIVGGEHCNSWTPPDLRLLVYTIHHLWSNNTKYLLWSIDRNMNRTNRTNRLQLPLANPVLCKFLSILYISTIQSTCEMCMQCSVSFL